MQGNRLMAKPDFNTGAKSLYQRADVTITIYSYRVVCVCARVILAQGPCYSSFMPHTQSRIVLRSGRMNCGVRATPIEWDTATERCSQTSCQGAPWRHGRGKGGPKHNESDPHKANSAPSLHGSTCNRTRCFV